jgi:hypothetical protein
MAEHVTHKVFLDLWDMTDAFDSDLSSTHSHLLAAHRRAVYHLRKGHYR